MTPIRRLFTRRARRERGAVAVEFALVLPVLVFLVFGLIDFGWMINRDTQINNAAREGAREGSLNPVAAEIKAAVLSNISQLPQTVTPANPVVTITCRKPDNSACSSAANFNTEAKSGGVVIVRVDYADKWVVPGFGWGSGINLSKTTEMRIE